MGNVLVRVLWMAIGATAANIWRENKITEKIKNGVNEFIDKRIADATADVNTEK